jgi:PST family polysaccharide transporter
MTDTEHDALRSKIRKAMVWNSLDTGLNRTGQFAMGLVVARLVAPSAFGIYAAALVVHMILISISDLGLGAALIRSDDGDVDANAPTVTTLALVSGLVLGALMALTAPLIARGLGVPAAAGTIRVMAISLPLAGLSAVPSALLQRGFRMDRMFIADTLNTYLGGGAVIPLALIGLGPLALALSYVAGQTLTTVSVWVYTPKRYWPGWDRIRAKALIAFTMPLIGSGIVANLLRNIDYVIVGRLMGPFPLGFYALAFNMSGWPQNLIGAVIQSVSLPAFARMRETGRDMAQAFSSALNRASRLTLPVCLFVGALAHPLIVLVYGEKWERAAVALVGLSIMGAARCLAALFADFLIASGSTVSQIVVQIIWVIPLAGLLLWFVHDYGIAGAGAAEAIVACLVMLPAYAYFVSRLGVPISMMARALLPVVAWTTFTGTVAWFVSGLIGSPLLACAAGGAAGLTIYVIPYRHELLGILAAVRRRGAQLLSARSAKARASDVVV